MKMDIILSKWCLAILFAFGILACTDGGDANELPKEPEGTGETQDEKIPSPGAVCPAMVKSPFLIFKSPFK